MNILITGASRGIGYQTALKFASEGTNTVFALSRNKNDLNRLRLDCAGKNTNSKLIPIVFDLEKILNNDISFVDIILSETDHLDILINNAGYLTNSPFAEMDTNIAKKIFDVNFFAPAQLIKALLPLLQKSHVVNIGSMGGFQGSSKFSGLSYYSASKAALATLTECLAEEYKDRSIVFNCLALGSVQTEMLNEAFPGYKAPLTAEQMATFVCEFAINGHNFFNGKIIPVSVSTP